MTLHVKFFSWLIRLKKATVAGSFLSFLQGKGLLFCSVVVFICLGAVSVLTHWTFSEVYPVHTARYFFSGEYRGDFLFSLKPFYNFFLFLSFQVSNLFSLYPMTVARFFFFLNGVVIAFLTWIIVKKKSDTLSATFALLILVSSPIFLERGFRIRSDLLVTALSLAALALAVFFRERKISKGFLYTFLILSLVFFITPKGIYWFIVLSFLIWDELKPLGRKDLKKDILFLLSLVFTVFFVTGFALRDPFFLMAIKKSGLFYWNNLQDLWGFFGKDTLNFWQFPSHTLIFISKNPHLIFFPLLKWVFIVFRKFIYKEREWKLTDISFILLFLIFVFHPYQKPFFISAMQPLFLLAFFTDPFWIKWKNHLFSPISRTFLTGFLLVFAILMAGFHLNFTIKRNNNFLQKAAFEKLNHFALDFPHVNIYDPQALLFKKPARHWYIGLYEEEVERIKKEILSHDIDVIYSSPWWNATVFRHWQVGKTGWVDVGNHLQYRSWQKKLDKNFQASGRELIELLKSDGFLKNREKVKKTWWYVFLNEKKRPIEGSFGHFSRGKNKSFLLQPWQLHREEDFLKGYIKNAPKEAREIAVLYLPPPQGFPEKVYLNSLLRYDIFPLKFFFTWWN